MTVPPQDPAEPPAELPRCVRHPDRPTGLSCVRCERPACPECLREASVGYQCVDCIAETRSTSRPAVTVAGARLAARPVVVPLLVIINLVIFAITVGQAGSVANNQFSALFQQWSLWPMPVVAFSEWWRLLTSGFLHYGLIHLLMNMIALWVIGRDLERLLGRLRFVAVYVVSLLGGGAAVFLFGDLRGPVAGASGAVFGLMGATAVAVIRLKLNPSSAIGIIVLNIAISFAIPGISLLGHLGGLVVGALATVGLVYAPAKHRIPVQAGTFLAITAALIFLIVLRDSQLAGTIICQQTTELRCAVIEFAKGHP